MFFLYHVFDFKFYFNLLWTVSLLSSISCMVYMYLSRCPDMVWSRWIYCLVQVCFIFFYTWVSHWGIDVIEYLCIWMVSLKRGRSYYKRNSTEFLIEFQILGKFRKFCTSNRLGWSSIFQTGYGTRCLTGSWLDFKKLRTNQGHAAVATYKPTEYIFLNIEILNLEK